MSAGVARRGRGPCMIRLAGGWGSSVMNRFMCDHHMGKLPPNRQIDMTKNITFLQLGCRVAIKWTSVIRLIVSNFVIVKGRRPPKERSDRKIKCNPMWFLWCTECVKIQKKKPKQECIPVGCVPSAAVAIYRGGGTTPGGVCSCGQGVCSRGCVSAPGGCLSAAGVSALGGGVSAIGGGGLLRCVYPTMHWGRQPLPTVDRQMPVKT